MCPGRPAQQDGRTHGVGCHGVNVLDSSQRTEQSACVGSSRIWAKSTWMTNESLFAEGDLLWKQGDNIGVSSHSRPRLGVTPRTHPALSTVLSQGSLPFCCIVM